MSQTPCEKPACSLEGLAPGKQDMKAQGTQAVASEYILQQRSCIGGGGPAPHSLLARLPAGCPAVRPSAPAARVRGPLLLPHTPSSTWKGSVCDTRD